MKTCGVVYKGRKKNLPIFRNENIPEKELKRRIREEVG
jgi:hypothetical protein